MLAATTVAFALLKLAVAGVAAFEELDKFRNETKTQISVIILSLESLVAIEQGRIMEARQKSEQVESLVTTLPIDFANLIDDQILAIVLSRELGSRILSSSQLEN